MTGNFCCDLPAIFLHGLVRFFWSFSGKLVSGSCRIYDSGTGGDCFVYPPHSCKRTVLFSRGRRVNVF